MVLSTQGMDVPAIVKVAFTDPAGPAPRGGVTFSTAEEVEGVEGPAVCVTAAKDNRVGAWAAANNVEIAHTPMNSSRLNRIEAQFTALRYFALRYFALDGTDHLAAKSRPT
jgi:hypothetical protein